MHSINEINTETSDGKVLIATLGRLSCQQNYSSKHPDEIYTEMLELANSIYSKQ